MNNKRKTFKKSEKLILLAAVVLSIFLIIFLSLPLHTGNHDEVLAAKGDKVQSEQLASEKQTNKHEVKEKNSASEREMKKQKQKTNKQEEVTSQETEQKRTEKNIANEDIVTSKARTDQGEQDSTDDGDQKSEQKDTQKDEEKIAYLTFDDGPSNADNGILDLLTEYEMKATFFMLEPNMKKHPDMIKKMIDQDQGVGLHGVSHDAKKIYASKDSLLKEMNKAQATLEKISGVQTVLIRVPFGSSPYMTTEYKQAVKQEGYKLWDWNVDSRDWKYNDKRYVADTINQIDKIRKIGGTPIILLHSKASTLEYLPELLDYLQDHNYKLKKIDETIEAYHF